MHLESDVSPFRWQRYLAIRADQEFQARARHRHALEAELDFICGQPAQRSRELDDPNLLICRLRNELNELQAPLEALELKSADSKGELE